MQTTTLEELSLLHIKEMNKPIIVIDFIGSIFIVFIITNSISVVNACQEILRKPSAALPMFCLRLRKRVKHTHFSKIKPGF